MIEAFKKCPEVPASCPDFDDTSTFSTVTTDLPENQFSESFILCRENTFSQDFIIFGTNWTKYEENHYSRYTTN